MESLFVWMAGRLVGRFDRVDETVTFGYSENAALISLSLPPTGKWPRKAPIRFLNNLLPDNPAVRKVMAEETNASSIDTFDLLDGADVSGGLVFTRFGRARRGRRLGAVPRTRIRCGRNHRRNTLLASRSHL